MVLINKPIPFIAGLCEKFILFSYSQPCLPGIHIP